MIATATAISVSALGAAVDAALVTAAVWLAWCGTGRLLAATTVRRLPTSAQALAAALALGSIVLLALLLLGAIETSTGLNCLNGPAAWATLLPLAAFGWRGSLGADPVRGAARRVAVLLHPRNPRPTRTILAWAATGACGVALVRGLGWPPVDYDALSYHLPFTAAALDGIDGIPFVDTPFGDSAQAYQPKNDALLRTVLAPTSGGAGNAWFGSEQLLRIGAWPHLPLLLLAVYVTARAIGCRRPAALLGATTTCLLGPVVLAQAQSAMVDLPFASWWIGGVALLVAARASSHATDVAPSAMAGMAFGLAYGTKFLAVPYTALLALLLVTTGPRTARTWIAWAAGAALTGGYFYARNALWTGNPIYPVELAIGSHAILPGNYGRAEMLDWIYAFRCRPEPLPVRLAMFTGDLFGYAFRAAPWTGVLTPLSTPTALALGGGLALWTGPSGRSVGRLPRLALWLVTPLALALCWWVVPYNYGRFAIPALAALGIGTAALGSRRAGLGLAGIAILGHLVWTTWLGSTAPPWTDARSWVVAWAILGFAFATAVPRRRGGRSRRWRFTPLLATSAAVAVGLAVAIRDAAGTNARDTAFPDLAQAWHVIADRRGAIAYTGTNLPWPLRHGEHGPRRVHAVALDGRPQRFDERARAWHADGLPAAICPEPAFYRRHRDPTAWAARLRSTGTSTLVVARLTGPQLLTIEHDQDGFPIERAWADALFEPILETAGAHVYAISPDSRNSPAAGTPLPGGERTAPDAFAVAGRGLAGLTDHYPRATTELAKPEYRRLLERALGAARSQ